MAQQRSAGRNISPPQRTTTSSLKQQHNAIAPGGSAAASPSLAKRLNHDYSAGPGSLSQPNIRLSATSGYGETGMTSYTPPSSLSYSTNRSASGHGKLHKRGSSGSSLPAPPSPMLHSQFAMPFATYEEPLLDQTPVPSVSSTPKIKPYIRKMSTSKQGDQGRIDLSKSVSENDTLAGLGIQDFGVRSVSDGSRRGGHARTTSVGSQVSTGSGSYRANQPFVHPMRQTPRPYTPPNASASASFVNEDGAAESDDVLEDDCRLGSYRSKRSVSISSIPVVAPTPLSQSHTATDLGLIPKLTSNSQTNLSIRSGKSAKSSKSKLSRSRRDTGPSFDYTATPSSRTSFDRAFSLMSRRSDLDAQTRDERIRAARRKFEEKEANKDRKEAKEQAKRRQSEEVKRQRQSEREREKQRERSRQKSQSQPPPKAATKLTKTNHNVKRKNSEPSDPEKHGDDMIVSRSYDDYKPANQMSLPRQGREAGMSEKSAQAAQDSKPSAQTAWVRFSAWTKSRMLNCAN